MQHIDKPWGHEKIWAETKNYVGKILFIKKGKRLSWQYHEKKEETILVLSGLLEVEFEKEGKRQTIQLKPGETFHNPPLQKHRFIGAEDVTLVEVSTPHLTDVVRLEDDYNRE
ncbi:MAG: cupin domain-containing protein [Deltaproteobacteria bacterium]|nr:cupin domain-containing protein [Deltaproteobacteria bacterium]